MARRYNKEDAKRRILSVCVKMFIEKGYHNSTMAEIMKEADVTSSSFHNIFPTKDAVLMDLTEFMFANQFSIANQITKGNIDPVLLYVVETSIQLTLAELNENLRAIYVEAYTQPKISEYIHQKTTKELYKIFGEFLPDCIESDFYELEIGSSGIMRAYMAHPCDMYFTLKQKLERFLTMSLSAYNVPKEKQLQMISYIQKTDIIAIANTVMQQLFNALAMEFDFKLKETN